MTEAQREIQDEILQLVGSDDLLGDLRRLVSLAPRHELGTDLGRKDVVQHLLGAGTKRRGARDVANQELDQRLRNARIDVVMRHLVADAVRAPAERQLRQITGPDDRRVVQVCQSKQMAGPLARLHVLERDVVDEFAARERMADVLQHLHA